jgi:glucose-1-phosphate adenylyltransferase
MAKKVVALILAGGQGTRLGILTDEIAKPAVPFGGKYRIIDFALSNCVNSGIYTVGVLTQYRPHVLSRHIGIGRPWDLDRKDGGVVILPPYVAQDDSNWYKGTANAVYQNIDYIDAYSPEIVVVLSGDHIYSMDYNEMIDYHLSKGADGTVACMRVPLSEAHRFGMMVTDFENRIIDFQEKPEKPRSDLASLGIYVFNWSFLKERLLEDEQTPESSNDFGKNILPETVDRDLGKLFAFVFEGYWRDVGTLQALWESNIELTRPIPPLNLHDPAWRFYTQTEEYLPAYVGRSSRVRNSLINEGAEIYGRIDSSVIFQGVQRGEGSVVRNSVIMTNTRIGKGVIIDKAIIGENSVINDDCVLGYGEEVPHETHPGIYDSGIVVVGYDAVIPAGTKIGKNCAIANHVREGDFSGDVQGGKTIAAKE